MQKERAAISSDFVALLGIVSTAKLERRMAVVGPDMSRDEREMPIHAPKAEPVICWHWVQ